MGALTSAYNLIRQHNYTYGHKADVYRYSTTTNSLGQTVLGTLSKVYSSVSMSYKVRRYPPKELTIEGIEFKNYYDAYVNDYTDAGATVTLLDGDKLYIGSDVYDVIKPKLEPFGYMALLVKQ
jgi:hypothetical protein